MASFIPKPECSGHLNGHFPYVSPPFGVTNQRWMVTIICQQLLLIEETLHQLRLVVYPIIDRDLYIPGGCLGFLNHQLYTLQVCFASAFSEFSPLPFARHPQLSAWPRQICWMQQWIRRFPGSKCDIYPRKPYKSLILVGIWWNLRL